MTKTATTKESRALDRRMRLALTATQHDPKICSRCRRGKVHTENPEGGKSFARMLLPMRYGKNFERVRWIR